MKMKVHFYCAVLDINGGFQSPLRISIFIFWHAECIHVFFNLWCTEEYFSSSFTSPIHLHIISEANELRTMKHMKYFLICIFTSIPLWCVMLCRGVEYQAAFSSDQPSLQDNLSCLSISIHCVWTALGELHPEARAACAAHNDFWCKLWCWNLNRATTEYAP